MNRPIPLGSRAPEFTLRDQFGQQTALADLRAERAALLVFYPFAFSGICTTELCSVRDDLSRFQNDRVSIAAISCDPMFTLKAWSEHEDYDFPLLSDFWPHGAVAKSYGVFDDDAGMAIRGTFLVGTDGTVLWSVVNDPGNARDLAAFEAALT